jgi:hypothetical protein
MAAARPRPARWSSSPWPPPRAATRSGRTIRGLPIVSNSTGVIDAACAKVAPCAGIYGTSFTAGAVVTTGARGSRNHRRHRTRVLPATGDLGTIRAILGRTVLVSVEASSLRSSPAATLDLACGPWREPVRSGPRDSGDPVKLVPKLAGGDMRSPTSPWRRRRVAVPRSSLRWIEQDSGSRPLTLGLAHR